LTASRTVKETKGKILEVLFKAHPTGVRFKDLEEQLPATSTRDIVAALRQLVREQVVERSEVSRREVWYKLSNLKALRERLKEQVRMANVMCEKIDRAEKVDRSGI